MDNIHWILSTTALALAGCATATPGARPHDMSATAHEQRAQEQDVVAAQHTAQYDPAAKTTQERCRARVAGKGGLSTGEICWTSVTNPTEGHLKQAEEHRRMAADHRAASASLRDAEARACVGISDDDRDLSPFEHPEEIAAVEPLKERVQMGRTSSESLAGAVVTIRAVPGLTAEWLQRIVDCHLARNSSLGHVVPEMPNCPLVPKGVEAKVTSAGNGFAVSIRSNDGETVKEILARARRLQETPVAPSRETK